MNRLEEELKKALQRVEPPAGFAERVLARAATEKKKKKARSLFGNGSARAIFDGPRLPLCASSWRRAEFSIIANSDDEAKRPRNSSCWPCALRAANCRSPRKACEILARSTSRSASTKAEEL